MYYSSVLLLLSLFVAVVTSQTAECIAAQNALIANAACYSAYNNIGSAITNDRNVSTSDLNVYCPPDCRNLVNRLIRCDNDPDSEVGVRFNEYLCNIDSNGVSCYDFIRSPRFVTLSNSVNSVCPDEIPAGQTCSSTCQTAFQNLVIDGGCCIRELFEFASSDADEELNDLLAQCPIDLSRGGTCTEIGGANGLKAFGSVLFLALIIALTGH